MANVTMPNGDVVAFPDDMPKAQIRSLIEKKFPDAKRRAQAKSGEKPYMTDLEGAVTAVTNVPAQAGRSLDDLGLMGAEAVTQALAPQVSRGVTPPARFTPGAPVEDYLTQPAAPLYDVKGTGIAQGLPDGTVSPVNLTALIPKEITDPIARAAAEASIRQQVASARTAEGIKPLDMNPDSLGGVIAGAAGSTAEMVAPAAVSLIMRNPAPLVAYFTTRVLGESYGEARRGGAGVDRSQVAAGFKAAAEAATEAIAGKVFVEGGKKLLGTVLKNAGVEGLTEAATEALQALVDVGVLKQDMTLDDVRRRVTDAGLIGAITGGVVSGATYPLRGKDGAAAVDPQVAVPDEAPVPEDTPIEDRIGLPGPPTMLALPSPEQFRTPDLPRRQPDAPRREEPKPPTEDELDYQVRVAIQRTKQAENTALMQTARETITPLGTFSVDEIGEDAAGKVRQHRIQMGRPVEAPVTIEDMARAKVPQPQIDAVIAQRRPVTSEAPLTALDIMRAADAKNIIPTDTNFSELALRTTGKSDVQSMSQAQLNALKTWLDAQPAHPTPVTVPLAEQSPFTDDQYGKALDAVRQQGRYTAAAIKEATGLKATKDVDAVRDAMVRRGQLVERGKGDYRLYDTLGVERQSVPDDLPPGAFREYTARRVPVSKVRVTKNGKSVDIFSSATEAREAVSKIREKDRASAVAIEPAADTAWGVMENRYDEQGNLLGSVVVDSYRDEADAQKALERLNAPPDTGARYTQTDVTPPPSAAPGAAPTQRPPMPPAFAGRLSDIVKRLNAQARDRKLPLLGVRVQLKPEITGPDGAPIEGFYLRKVISLATQYLSPGMSTDQIVESLARVMDHETIHALRAAGVLSPETDGWKTIVRYTRRAKRPDSTETYFDWAQRNYGRPGNPDGPLPGYETRDSIEEEAIAEAFRAWASNRRNVAGKPATVFRQIVEWFKRLLNAVPEDAFRAIETGTMVSEALTPRGSDMTRARETRKMESAAAEISEAQKVRDENLVQVKSREYLRAREQARDDRFGRSGPKTVLGTTPTKAYSTGDVGDTALARSFADKYRQENGVEGGRLMTLLPVDADYMIRIADAQQRGVHAPGDAAVAKAYRALINETKRMYQALGDLEVTAWTGAGAPYDSPASMLGDIASGKLTMRLSDDTFGPGADNPGHPLNAASGYKTTDGRALTNNDIFRVVHDVYGHGQSGFVSDERGSYNAYHEHARLLSPEARRALATETLAQDAWHRFGPHLRRSDGTVPRGRVVGEGANAQVIGDVDYLADKYKEFAEQKAFLLDDEVVGADPGWAMAEKASGVEETPRFSLAPPVESDAFKRWFGDSKAVNADGSPKVLYHGTAENIEAFSPAKRGASTSTAGAREAFWFSASPANAEEFAYLAARREVGGSPSILPVYLSMKNPLDVDGSGEGDSFSDTITRAKATGHDGVIFRNANDSPAMAVLNIDGFPTDADARGMFVSETLPAFRKGEVSREEAQDELNEAVASAKEELAAARKAGDKDEVAFYKADLAMWTEIRDAFARDPESLTLTRGVGPADVYAVFQPGQIKSVFNQGTFDPADERIRYSRFDDNLPGGRLYGNPNRSPGGALSAPGTPTPAFTSDRPGNQFFGGELAEEQLRMAREGDRGAAMIYMSPDDFLALSGAPINPEQEVYNEAIEAGYKLSGFPSLVTSGYAGVVRAVDSDSTAGAAALVGRADQIPVVLYPKDGQSLGLVTALEAPDGSRMPWPHDGRAENFPKMRGPRYSVGSEKFRAWFGDSKVVGPDGQPLVVYHGTVSSFDSFQVGDGGNGLALGAGIYASADPKYAARYAANSPKDRLLNKAPEYREGANLMPVYMALQNPLVFEPGGGLPTGPELTALAKERGHDGVIYHTNTLFYEVVAFNPEQVKSAVANRGTYDAADPDIRYSLNAPFGTRVPSENNARLLGPSPRYSLNRDEEFDLFGGTTRPRDKAAEAAAEQPAEAPRRNYNIVQQRIDGWVGRAVMNIARSKKSLPVVGSIYDWRVKLEDRMLSVKEMIEQIKEAGGNIDDLNDTYMLEQLYHGKVFDQIQQREQDLQVPLLEALRAAYNGPNKVTPQDLEDYLYAHHAPERNAYLRARGAADPNPSGMSDAEASAILDRLALDGKLPDLEVLASMAYAITADTTRTRVEAGLISAEAAASSPYQYYVPLRGFAEEELDPGSPSEMQTHARSGKGFSIGGREDRTVTGRSRKAGDLLGHLFLQNTEAVIRAQKNEVVLSFMRLLQQNAEFGFGQIFKTAPTRRVVGANGMIHEAGDPSYRQDPLIVTAKWKGKEIVARVADPRLARALKSDYVTSSSDMVAALNEVTRKMRFPAAWNRIQAAVNTSLNPVFVPINFLRDWQTASIQAEQFDIPNLGKNIRANAFKALGGIKEVLRDGTANSDMAKLFLEMQKAGGTTEFLGLNDLETQVKRIRKSITQSGARMTMRQAGSLIGYIGKFANDYNKIAENALRLAAYKAAREAGVSVPQSAFLAKNITVNFNKGGELKPFFNSWFLFYNAGTQGNFAGLRGLKNRRMRRLLYAIVAMGLTQDFINRLLSGDDDENGVTDYDDIPDHVLQQNFVIMDYLGLLPKNKTGGMGYFSVPMPWLFNAFYNTGRNMGAAVSGSKAFGDTVPEQVGNRILNSLIGFADALNPLGGVQNILNFIAPTIADPFVDVLVTNRDYADRPIVPERPTFGVPVPDSQKYWSNTDGIPVWVAEQLNSLGGGNEVRKGAPIAGVIPTDISPEVLQHAFDYVLGGVGRLASRGFDLGFNIVTGDTEDIEISSIPLVSRFAGSVGSQANTERYYNIAKEIELVEKEIQTFGESDRLEEAQRVVDQNPVEVSLIQFFKNTQKSLQDLRRQRKVIEANDQIEAGQKREVIRQIKERQDAIMRRANTVYFEQKKAVR